MAEFMKAVEMGLTDFGKSLRTEVAEMIPAEGSKHNSINEVELLATQAKGKAREGNTQQT